MGVVRELRDRSETRGNGRQGFTQQVRSFRLDRYEVGNRLPPIPVEMRGESFWGVVSEGDWVACWLPVKDGLTPHGLRHSHKTYCHPCDPHRETP